VSARRDPAFRIGPWVPAVLPAVVLGLLGTALSLLVLDGGWTWVGVVLSVVAAVRRAPGAAWTLIGVLVLGELARSPASVGAQLLLLVAGVHLLAVLAAYAAVLPVAGRLELAALLRPARTWALIQLPAQALTALVLALSGRLTAVPLAAEAGAAVLLLVAGTLAALLARAAPPA
jgi:hypothetical protein